MITRLSLIPVFIYGVLFSPNPHALTNMETLKEIEKMAEWMWWGLFGILFILVGLAISWLFGGMARFGGGE